MVGRSQRSLQPAAVTSAPSAPEVEAGGSNQAAQASLRSAAPTGGGAALPPFLAEAFAASFGTSLDGVRIHTDPASAEAAEAEGARAFTVGQDIWFAQGAYDPASADGQRLLAHEVAHAVQQGDAAGPVSGRTAEGGAVEQQADQAADRALAGQAAEVTAAAPAIAREPAPQRCEPATEQEQQAARTRILEAQRVALETVRKNATWSIGQFTKFIGDTAEAPGVVYSPSLLGSAFALVGQSAAYKAAGAVGGVPGWILSRGLAALGKGIGTAVGGAPMKPEDASDAGREAFKQALLAQIATIDAQADGAVAQMAPSYQEALDALAPRNMDRAEVARIQRWADDDIAANGARVAAGDGLYLGMLSQWVASSMKNYKQPKSGVNATSYYDAVKKLYGDGGIPPRQYWAVQLRAEWVKFGLPTGKLDGVVSSGAEPPGAGTFGPMVDTTVFTQVADRNALADGLGKPRGEPLGDQLRAGAPFTLTCTAKVSVQFDQNWPWGEDQNVMFLEGSSYTLDLGDLGGESISGDPEGHGHGLF